MRSDIKVDYGVLVSRIIRQVKRGLVLGPRGGEEGDCVKKVQSFRFRPKKRLLSILLLGRDVKGELGERSEATREDGGWIRGTEPSGFCLPPSWD